MQHMIEEEESVEQIEFHTTFIPTQCLEALDDDFLCGEDLLGHPSIIIQGDEYIDNIHTLDIIALTGTTTIDRNKGTNEPLQISTFLVEMKTITFDDIDELVIKRSVDEKAKSQL